MAISRFSATVAPVREPVANRRPVWQTASGSIGSDYNGRASSFSVKASGATSYALLSGSLPTSQTLNTTTGVISGTASGLANYTTTTYTFVIRASNAYGFADRAFSIEMTSRYVGYCCDYVGEGGTIRLICPEGYIFNSRIFSSFGTPGGSCGAWSLGACSSVSSRSWAGPIGFRTASVNATVAQWGDPCYGTQKAMAVQFTFGAF